MCSLCSGTARGWTPQARGEVCSSSAVYSCAERWGSASWPGGGHARGIWRSSASGGPGVPANSRVVVENWCFLWKRRGRGCQQPAQCWKGNKRKGGRAGRARQMGSTLTKLLCRGRMDNDWKILSSFRRFQSPHRRLACGAKDTFLRARHFTRHKMTTGPGVLIRAARGGDGRFQCP